MDLLEIMRTRRSIRSYKNESVSEENITKILEAGLLSASGKAIRPWEFIVVEDKDNLQKLSDCRAGGVKMLRERCGQKCEEDAERQRGKTGPSFTDHT